MQKTKYIPKKSLASGYRINVLGMNCIPITTTKKEEIIAFKSDDELYLFNIVAKKRKNDKAIIFVIKNHDLTKNLLANFRKFKKYHIESLQWNGIGLETVQKSKIMPGYVRDFDIEDFNNDGCVEFVAPVVSREGTKLKKETRSSLVYFKGK